MGDGCDEDGGRDVARAQSKFLDSLTARAGSMYAIWSRGERLAHSSAHGPDRQGGTADVFHVAARVDWILQIFAVELADESLIADFGADGFAVHHERHVTYLSGRVGGYDERHGPMLADLFTDDGVADGFTVAAALEGDVVGLPNTWLKPPR